MDFDEFLIDVLGEFGTFQKILFFLLSFTSVTAAFYNLGVVFIMANPDYWCRVPSVEHLNLTHEVFRNLTHPTEVIDGIEVYKQCEIYDRDYSQWTESDVENTFANGHANNVSTVMCTDGFVYDDSIYKSTIVMEWDLTCDKGAWLQATASSIYMSGLMIGVFLFGNISDRFGRRPAFIACQILMVLSAIAVSFAPNYVAFCVLRFLLAVFTVSLYTTSFVLIMEMVGSKWRVHCGINIMYGWVLGTILTGVTAYYTREWRTMSLLLSVPVITMFGLIPFVPESPRWLYASSQPEKGHKVLERVAKWNKVDLKKDLEISTRHTGKAYMWDLFRTPRMRLRTFNMYYNWMVNSMVYYGLSLNTSNLGGNDFVNYFVSALVEIPAYIFCVIALLYMGRKIPVCGSMIFAGVALILTMAVPTHLNWLSITLAMLGKMAIAASFAIIYIFTAEMYPTPVRNVAVASGSLFARIGGIIAPYIGQLSMYSKVFPLVIFGVVSVIAGLLALLLPETKGKHLPETLEDGENFGLDDKTSKLQAVTPAGVENLAMDKDREADIGTSDPHTQNYNTFNTGVGVHNQAYEDDNKDTKI